jgi:hypothetical protein
VHVKDENVLYEGNEKIPGVSVSEISNRIQHILPSIVRKYKIDKQTTNAVKGRGELKLKTPFNTIRTVPYSIEVRAIDNGYEYLIDSVSFIEQTRGEKSNTKSSKEFLENMSEQGSIVGETEKILNETDMRFQKLLALLRSGIGKD